ncbi:uncharacterized protein EHS24_009466 [Apiotrichum porosum]|uniref:Micro-fibrillar-associated protein 1 C-terminal domain-containing protein n=1 Tax=Apiotrichum porosum TaxID=105984 RepID=A0A427XLR3_9TREE|nr:uncharacterized protein EHS24_009466 [Apiotrichum porosum]RSH79806.1 hypothetical protein EHS24_009466 [Apiotrichum porosum]
MPAPQAPRAKPAKVRYFKGKPGGAVADSDSDSGEDETIPLRTTKQVISDPSIVAGGAGRVIRPETLKDVKPKIKMDLGSVKIPDGGVSRAIGEESDDESEEESEEETKPAFIPKMEDSSEYETDSEEESEEEVKPAFRPVFVGKNARKTVTADLAAKEAEEAEKREEEEREQRKLDSKDLAGETIRRELAEKEVSNDLIPDVDDTDGLDAEGEFDAWRARELARLLREKTAQAQADAEREEIERRRAMPEDQRLAEDMAYADGTRAAEKGEMGFLQTYYHKGAFHQDDDSEIFRRDYTGASESQVDMSALPAVMQVRNFGKKSRSKYTHLTDQDTSSGGWGTGHQAFARPGDVGQQQQGCWNCGGPHNRADCPNNNMNDPNVIGGVNIGGSGAPQSYGGGFGGRDRGGPPGGSSGPTSSNSAALGSGSGSRWGQDSGKDRSDRHSGERRDDKGREREYRDRERDRYDDSRRDDRRSGRDRERSRSPRRRDDGGRRDDERRSGRDDRDRGSDRHDRDRRERRDRSRDRDRRDRR